MSDTKSLIKYVRDRLEDGPNLTFGKPTVRDLVEALEAAEAEVARLTSERDWLLAQPVFIGICPRGVDNTACLSQCWQCWKEAARKAVTNETSGYRECATCKHGDVNYPGATKCRECSTCCEDSLSSWEGDSRKAVSGEG